MSLFLNPIQLVRLFSFVFLCTLSLDIYAQSGPAGVQSGVDNPGPVFWLRADEGVTESGGVVTAWGDQMGANDLSNFTNAPTYSAASINGRDAILFDGDDEMLMGNSTRINDGTQTEKTFFVAFQTGSSFGSGTQVIYEQGGTTNGMNLYIDETTSELVLYIWENQNPPAIAGQEEYYAKFSISTNTIYIASIKYEGGLGAGSTVDFYVNSTTALALDGVSDVVPSNDLNEFSSHTGDISIGGAAMGETQTAPNTATPSDFYFDGLLAEMINYDVVLNDAEFNIVYNYLGEKYGVALTAGDLYADATYSNYITAIGQSGTDAHLSGTGNGGGLSLIDNGGVDTNGDYIFAGHDGGIASISFVEAPAGESRLNRIWKVEETGTVDDLQIVFDLSALGLDAPADVADYGLLYRVGTSGDFSEVTTNITPSLSNVVGTAADDVVFTLSDFATGYYTIQLPFTKIFTPGQVAMAAGVQSSSDNPGPVFWLNADEENLELTGSSVTNWIDEIRETVFSPQGNNTTQPTLSDINGENALSFDGDDLITSEELADVNGDAGSATPLVQSDRTMFFAFETPSSLSGPNCGDNTDLDNYEVIYEQGGAGNGFNVYINKCNSQVYIRAWEDANSTFGTFAVSPSTKYIVSLVYDADIGSNGTISFYNANQLLSTTTAGWLDLFNRHTGDIGIGGVDNDSEFVQSDETTILEVTGDNLSNFNGKIGEIVFYNVALNDAEHTVVSNYLGEKFGVTLLTDDFYTQPAYNQEVIGIGQTGTDLHAQNTGNGGDLYLINDNGINVDGEYVMAGHNGNVHGYTTNSAPTDASRWSRIWYFEKTGTIDNIIIAFDTEGAGFGPADLNRVVGDYELLYRAGTSGTFTVVSASAKNVADVVGTTDADVVFSLTDAQLLEGYYTLKVPKQIDWFTYRSGSWEEPLNWTLDPTGTRRLNPDSGYPSDEVGDADNVTILNGDEIVVNSTTVGVLPDLDASGDGVGEIDLITLNVDNGGVLDLTDTEGHSTISIVGTGKIKLSGDNFLSGNTLGALGFATVDGGTVEFYGSSDYDITTAHTFNNVVVNLTTGSTLTQLNNLFLNGDLDIENGEFRINDNSSITPLNINIGGDMIVQTDGVVTVGTGDAISLQADETITFHQLDVNGDFTNTGTVLFHNITPAHIADSTYFDYYPSASDADDADQSVYAPTEYGVVEALFNNPTKDQMVVCNGPTEFYRIEVNKGTSQTYICEISASDPENFKLYGRLAMRQEDDDLIATNQIDNPRALGLETGILKLSDNIIIPEIAKLDQTSAFAPGNNDTEAGFVGGNRNYVIDNDAQLWIASNAQVIHNYGWGIHVFGSLKVSDDGFFGFTELQPRVDNASGLERMDILIDVAGVFEQSGGDVNTTQFRTKIGGASVPRGSFILTGGVFNVGNGGGDARHAVFSVPWPEMLFRMTGDGPGDDPVMNINLTNSGKSVSAADQALGVPGSVTAALQISSSEGNYEVTAGTVNVINNSNSDYLIVSTAPFYNLNIFREVVAGLGRRGIWLAGVEEEAEDATPTSGAQEAQDLVVLNNFSVFEDSLANGGDNISDTELHLFGKDLYIGGDFLFSNDDTQFFTTENGGSTIYLNGSGDQTMIIDRGDFEGTNDNGPTSGIESLVFTGAGTKTLVIDDEIAFNGDNLNVFKSLTISSGVTLDLDDHTITVQGDVTNSGEVINTGGSVNGKILLSDGAGIHTLSGDGTGIFNNLELNDANGAILTSEQTVNGTLTMTSGILDLETLPLTIAGADGAIATSGTFDNTLMIATAGNSSDGGLVMYLDADETLLFPIGIEGATDYYLPATLDMAINGATAEYININPVDKTLATTNQSGGDLLGLYWKVNHGFTGTIPTVNSASFIYGDPADDDFVVGDDATYVAGQVLDESPFTRSGENFQDADESGALGGGEGASELASVDESNNTILFDGIADTGFDLQNANYTAGVEGRFLGGVTVYYSRATNGNWIEWNNDDIWSVDPVNGHFGPPNPDNSVPGPGDIVIIGSEYVNSLDSGPFSKTGDGRHQIRIDIDQGDVEVAEIIFDSEVGGSALSVIDMSRLRVTAGYSLTAAVISGRGEMVQDVGPSNPANFGIITADIGDFADDPDNGWFFWIQGSAGATTIVNDFDVYPTFRTFGADGLFQFGKAVSAQNMVVDNATTFQVANDLNIVNTVILGSNGEGYLEFIDVGSTVTLECVDIEMTGGADSDNNTVSVANAGSDEHVLRVKGDITFTNGSTFDLSSPAGSNVILELAGSGTNSVIDNASVNMDLYRIEINKGTDITNSFTFSNLFTIADAGDIGKSPLEIVNGTLILDNAGVDFVIADDSSGDFLLPSVNNPEASSGSGALDLRSGTVRIEGTSTGMVLNGKLSISGGNVILDGGLGSDNFLEYGSSGDSEIELSSGSLLVGSQLRQNLISTTGVLKYTQTGGTAVFGFNSAPDIEKGMFEVVNIGSTLTLNNDTEPATFAIAGAQANPTLGTLIIGNNVALGIGATNFIDIGYAGTVAGVAIATDATNVFNLNIAQEIPNLRIDGDNSNSPIARTFINPLVIGDSLTIRNNGTLNANGLDLTVKGDFLNDGSFQANGNTTTFNGATQTISGTSATTFFVLESKSTSALTLDQAITVSDDLYIESGVLDDDGNQIDLKGDLFITTSHQGSAGINFSGSATQQIFLPDLEATVENISINNSNNVELGPLSSNVALRIDGNLKLNSLFLIGDNRIIVSPNGSITTDLSGFSKDVMISCNGSQADDGLEIEFNDGDLSFTLPVGIPDKYLPVTFDFTSAETATASVLVKPIQPTTYPYFSINDGAGGAADGQTNTLPYYWFVTTTANDGSDELDGFLDASMGNPSLIFQYEDADIRTEAGDEADYGPARLVVPFWSKLDPAKVDDGLNQIQYLKSDLGSGTDVSLTGFYTAGDATDIPNSLAQYISVADGVWNVNSTWRQDANYDRIIDGAEAAVPVLVQPGSIVIIDAAHTVQLNIPDIDNFSTEIEGTLNVGLTDGHYLGIVAGTGILSVEQQVIPAFDVGLSTFFTTTGGELNFAGVTDYTISSNFSDISGLTLSGGGTKTLPAIDYNIGLEDLEITEGTILDNAENDTDISVEGDVLVTNGTFLTGDNTVLIEANDLIVSPSGVVTSTGALFDLSGNLELAGGTINAGAGNFNLEGDLIRSSGIFVDGTSTITFDGSTPQLISGDFTTTNSLRNVVINNSGTGDVVSITGNSDVEIANRLTLTDGRVFTDATNTLNITNTNPLAINNSISQAGFTTASYVNGPLSRQMLETTAPFPFPIGDGANNGYMEIRDPDDYTGGTNKRFEVEYFAATPPLDVETLTADAMGIGVQSASSVEYWRITTPSDATSLLGLHWDALSGVTDPSDIRIVWLNNPTGDAASTPTGDEQWDLLSRDLVSGTASQGFVSSSERLSYSTQIVTLATTNESSSPLPVEMLYFTGIEDQGVVDLDWATATEIDNDYFEIQRSQDGRDWEVIGVVTGAGSTVEEQQYDFSDFKPYVGNSFYRLRQVDYDGQFAFTDIILVNVRLEPISFNVYPNPVRDVFTLDIKGINANEETPYSIISLQGAYVGQGVLRADEAGRISEQLSLNYGQPAGIYLLRVESSQRIFRFNLIKQ